MVSTPYVICVLFVLLNKCSCTLQLGMCVFSVWVAKEVLCGASAVLLKTPLQRSPPLRLYPERFRPEAFDEICLAGIPPMSPCGEPICLTGCFIRWCSTFHYGCRPLPPGFREESDAGLLSVGYLDPSGSPMPVELPFPFVQPSRSALCDACHFSKDFSFPLTSPPPTRPRGLCVGQITSSCSFSFLIQSSFFLFASVALVQEVCLPTSVCLLCSSSVSSVAVRGQQLGAGSCCCLVVHVFAVFVFIPWLDAVLMRPVVADLDFFFRSGLVDQPLNFEAYA